MTLDVVFGSVVFFWNLRNELQKPNPLTGDHAIDAARYVIMMVLENPNRGKYYLY